MADLDIRNFAAGKPRLRRPISKRTHGDGKNLAGFGILSSTDFGFSS